MRTSRILVWIHCIFLASGMSGLVYQVIWIREFGNLFGNTVHSAALVTAIFMLGLGLGGYWLGGWVDRRSGANFVRLYGAMEMLIAAFGLTVALIFPHLEAVSAAISSYAVGDNGWYELTTMSYFARYALAIVLLLPITLVMGGTLPVLLRYALRAHMRESGWRVGTLYGINTLGAAVGALAVDFLLVPALGLFASQFVAVTINLVVGLVALRLAPAKPEPAGPSESSERSPIVWPVFAALFATGLVGMGLEILWFRFLVGVVGSYRPVLSLLLGVLLTGLWLGSLIGGYAVRKGRSAGACFLIAQCGTVVTALISLAAFMPEWRNSGMLKDAFLASPAALHGFIELIYQTKVLLLVLGVPAFFMGFGYPVANALVQTTEARIGRRAGGLYLANTVGGMLGSLATGYLLLPYLGMKNALGVLCLAAFAAAWLLARHLGLLQRLWPALLLCATLLAACITFALPHPFLNDKIFKQQEQGRLLALSEGVNETLAVVEAKTGRRVLMTNGHKMSATEIGDQRYMGAFVHIPLLQIDNPESVLVICFGVGNTLHSASLHPSVRRLHIVDLSKNILSQAGFFSEWNHDVLKDPRVSVFINDGRLHLRMNSDVAYDLITLEPPPIAHAGVSALYSREFYELAKRRLKPGGYMTQWLPVDQVPGQNSLELIKAFIEVFPDSVLLDGYYNSLMLMGRKDAPIEMDPDKVLANLAARPEVARHMSDIDLDNLLEIAGSFVASHAQLTKATENTLALTDDHPEIEYSHHVLSDYFIPENIFALNEIKSWCPKCSTENGSLNDLGTYMAILDAFYKTEGFRHYSTTVDVPREKIQLAKSMGDVPGVIGRSRYLQLLFSTAK